MSKTKTIKFFISSTFKDFEQERDILHKFVFPELKDLCHKEGFGFQPIDLRWGVMEEAGHDQQTMNICLNEIKRSSYEPNPNLLLLVGQRYGWVPIPYDIEAKEFDEIIVNVSSEDEKLIREWYILDENAVPHSYYLKDKYEYKGKRKEWTKIEDQIRAAFQKATDLKRYHTSATEQEMYEGLDAFSDKVDHKHTFSYFRTIENYDKADAEKRKDFIDDDLSKLNELSKKLKGNSNIPKENQIISKKNVQWNDIEEATQTKYEQLSLANCPAYLKEFHDEVLRRFTEAIQTEIGNYKKEAVTELEIELDEQEKFLNTKSKIVIGRKVEVDRITNFIKSEEEPSQYYLQYGKSGSGKTSVMASAISSIDKNKYEVIYRFIGTSALSTYSIVLFESIYWQIQTILENKDNIPKPQLEHDEYKFKQQFQDQLAKLKDKQVVIFLDALDQFEDYNDLTILLDGLQKNIKIVFSTLYDEEKKDNSDYSQYYNRLEYLKNKYLLEELQAQSNLDILNKWLEANNRKLTNDQLAYIKNKTSNKTPLYLKLVFEIVKHWKHTKDDCFLEETEEGLIKQFFSFIQKQYHHEKSLIRYTLGLISASKDGLSEEELIDLFSRDTEFLELFQNERYQKLDRLPNAIWSRFYFYIQEFFTEKFIDGEMLINPFHRIISETMKKEYYKESLHKNLADYFLTLQDKNETWDKRYNNIHMLSETPYQLFHSKDSKRLKEILFDLEFAGSVYDNHKQESFRSMLEKATELDGITEDDIYPWESFYREKEHLITKVDEEMWRPHQSLFQLAYEDGKNSSITEEAEKLLDNNRVNFNWLKKKNRNKEFKRSGLIKVLQGHTKEVIDTTVLKDEWILSYSKDHTLRLWSYDGKPLNVLNGHTGYINGTKILNNEMIVSYSNDNTFRLWSSDGSPLKFLEGHTGIVKGVKILNDGRLLSYSEDNTLRLWSSDGNPLKVLEGHTDEVNGVEILEDGRILSYSFDKTLRLWSSLGEPLNVLKGHRGFVEGVQILKDGRILSYSWEQTLRLWSNEGKFLKVLEGHIDEVNGVEILEDGRILSYSEDNTFRLWSSDGSPLKFLEGHTGIVKGVKILNDGRLLSYSEDNTLRLWSSDGNPLKVLEGHTDEVNGVEILEDGRIISYSEDNTFRLWSSHGKPLKVLEGHTGIVNGVKILNNGRLLSYSEDNTLRLWNSSETNLSALEWQISAIQGIKILKDRRILSYSEDNTLKLWSSQGNLLKVLEGHTEAIEGIEIMENGRILSYSWDNTLRLWSAEGEPLNVLKGHTDAVTGVEILEDGRILSYSWDNTLRLWSVEGEPLNTLEWHTGPVQDIIFLRDGSILSCSWDYTLRLWSSEGEPLIVFEGHTGLVNGVKILKDERIVSYSEDSTLMIWNSEGEPFKVLQGHTDKVNGVEILEDGKILSYSEDNTFRLWSSDGNPLKVLEGHIDKVNGVKVLKDGRILSYSKDGTLRIWDDDGKLLSVLEGHKDSVYGSEILEDGKILSYSRDNTLMIWSPEGKPLGLYNLTKESSTIRQIVNKKSLVVSSGKYLLVYNINL